MVAGLGRSLFLSKLAPVARKYLTANKKNVANNDNPDLLSLNQQGDFFEILLGVALTTGTAELAGKIADAIKAGITTKDMIVNRIMEREERLLEKELGDIDVNTLANAIHKLAMAQAPKPGLGL